MIEKPNILILSLLAFMTFDLVHAQMVGFRLELEAGVNFNSSLHETVSKDGKNRTLWVEMLTQENIQVLVQMKNENGESVSNPFLVVNDGSGDFSNAMDMNGTGSFQIREDGKLKSNTYPRISYYSAWIGIPFRPKTITVIEYH